MRKIHVFEEQAGPVDGCGQPTDAGRKFAHSAELLCITHDNTGNPVAVVARESGEVSTVELRLIRVLPLPTALEEMSIRDYFAAKAMEGILSNPAMLRLASGDMVAGGLRRDEWVSEQAYDFAEAMKMERNK